MSEQEWRSAEDSGFEATDPLSVMMRMQRNLQTESFGTDPTKLTGVDRIQFFKEMKLALDDEMHEALDEMGWKIWATSKHWNDEAVKSELIDAWHFFMNLMLVAGLTPDELLTRYLKKHGVNVARQEAGYDGVSTKCPTCHRALDDDAVTCHPFVNREGWCCHKDANFDG